jgi:hypothetical protein
MSNTRKEGKRGWRHPVGRPESAEIGAATAMRHSFGGTEKVLRRNRKTWTRLGNKRRRQLDKESAKP